MSIGDFEIIILRPYQNSAVKGTHDLIRDGERIVLLVMPTGAGKGVIFTWWVDRAAAKGKHVLFVTNRRTLVMQAARRLEKQGIAYSITMGEETTPYTGELVTVASLQTLRKRHFFDRYGMPSGVGLPPADVIFIDEAHLDLDSYKMLFEFYADAKIIGTTATPVGPSGKALTAVWPAMHVGIPKSELIRIGNLVPTKLFAPSEPDMQGVKITSRKEFAKNQVARRVRECTIFADVFDAWQPWSDLPTVVFAPGVEFGRWLSGEWRKRGYNARSLDGTTKEAERAEIFQGIRNREVKVLVSVDALKVGFDEPCLACGIDLQPTLQLRDYVQKTGRICRKDDGKFEAVWIDMSGAYWRHGHPDMDVPWGDLHENETVEDLMMRHKRSAGRPDPIICPWCKAARYGGDTCTNCGRVSRKHVRYVRMGDGKVHEQAPPTKQEQKEAPSKGSFQWQQKNWNARLARCYHRNMTVSQARGLYYKELHEWPTGLRKMPPEGDPDWDRTVREVYPEFGKKKASRIR